MSRRKTKTETFPAEQKGLKEPIITNKTVVKSPAKPTKAPVKKSVGRPAKKGKKNASPRSPAKSPISSRNETRSPPRSPRLAASSRNETRSPPRSPRLAASSRDETRSPPRSPRLTTSSRDETRSPPRSPRLTTSSRDETTRSIPKSPRLTASPSKTSPQKLPTKTARGITQKSKYFVDDSLDEHEQKYCRCLLHVSAKQNKECLNTGKAGEKLKGKQCYSPYAVCTKSVGRKGKVSCGPKYNFPEFPDDELKAYAYLNKIPVPRPYSKQKLLENIAQWKSEVEPLE